MPLRFAGQYSDDEVGLFYNYFRFYNPETGRYIENDPIDLQGGLNRYGYVGGSPLHYVDPYGLNPATIGMGCALGSWAGPIGCGAGAVVGGLIGTVATIAILSTPSDSVKDDTNTKDKEDDCEECPPCSPYPVGTVGYIGPKKSYYGKDGILFGSGEEHYKIYSVKQDKRDCSCYWAENGKKIVGAHHYYHQPNIWYAVNLNHKYPSDTPRLSYP